MKNIILSLTLFAFSTAAFTSSAQNVDAEDCKDHSFFNRMTNFYIQECLENYNEHTFYTGADEQSEIIEGNLVQILYSFDYDKEGKEPSALQIIRNYETAILKNGGKTIYYNTGKNGMPATATFRFVKDNLEYTVALQDFVGGEEIGQYRLLIISREPMKQEITSDVMFDQVNSGNPLTLYINFATGKSVIQQESLPVIDELYKMLSENPSLKIMIEGHTDNTGDKAANKKLSLERAESVKQALVKKGIAADRLKTSGFGQEVPVADNSTDEGKSKNRRVEIKKIS